MSVKRLSIGKTPGPLELVDTLNSVVDELDHRGAYRQQIITYSTPTIAFPFSVRTRFTPSFVMVNARVPGNDLITVAASAPSWRGTVEGFEVLAIAGLTAGVAYVLTFHVVGGV